VFLAGRAVVTFLPFHLHWGDLPNFLVACIGNENIAGFIDREAKRRIKRSDRGVPIHCIDSPLGQCAKNRSGEDK
jgi:hypothetical protein